MTDETKEFASIEDATPTTAIPSETDATTATTTMVTVDDRTDTTVLPSAADDDETAVLPVPDNHADASVSDVDTQATAASPSPFEPTTNRIAQETVADAVEGDGGPVPSADDVPMYAASSARPPYEQSQTAGKPCQPGGSAKNVQNAKDVQNAKNIQKQSTSAPTVVIRTIRRDYRRDRAGFRVHISGSDDFAVLAESAIADGYYLRRSGTDSGNSGRCMGHSRCRQEEKIVLQPLHYGPSRSTL